MLWLTTSRSVDSYHSCYVLAGLSATQNHHYRTDSSIVSDGFSSAFSWKSSPNKSADNVFSKGDRQIQQGNNRHSAICASTKRQKVDSSHARCLTYRTSSSPPSQTRNPPSGCLSRLSHCHLHKSDAHHASTEMNNSHRVSIYQSQCLTTNHGKRQHGRITACQMRSLAMATSKSSGGVLHGTESCDDTVLVSTSCTPFFSRSFYYLN